VPHAEAEFSMVKPAVLVGAPYRCQIQQPKNVRLQMNHSLHTTNNQQIIEKTCNLSISRGGIDCTEQQRREQRKKWFVKIKERKREAYLR
jgi:hypothetical protein